LDYLVATHHVEPQPIVSIRGRRPADDVPAFIQGAFKDLFGRLRLLAVVPAGPPFVIYHEFAVDGIDAEVSVPIDRPISAAGRMVSRILPAMTVAGTVHLGSYEALSAAYAAVSGWIRDHGSEAAGPMQERYLNGPGDDVAASAYRTEVEIPVIPSAVIAAG
jgi:effector-binding domain-containing protein